MTSNTGTSMVPLDRRRHAFRPDLADRRLEGRVTALRYVGSERYEVAASSVPVRTSPKHDAGIDTEALFGELVDVFEIADGWAWVQLVSDGYVGYVPRASLQSAAEDLAPASHAVRALGTFIYPAADMKRPPRDHLSLGARVRIVEESDRFARIASPVFGDDAAYWVIRRHLGDVSKPARDFVDMAERLIGTPYLWGGKTRLGLDCSGLVQIALDAAGISAPRDSDMQEAELGMPVLVPENLEGLERGDLIFWRGHVGIMTDGIMMVHANGHHMTTVAEPLAEAAARIARTGSRITGIRRLPALSASARVADAA